LREIKLINRSEISQNFLYNFSMNYAAKKKKKIYKLIKIVFIKKKIKFFFYLKKFFKWIFFFI